MSILLICLAPVLLVASIADGARSLTDGLAPEMVAQSWHTVAAACITITTMVLAFPTCLSRLTRARRIAGSPLAGRVAELTARLDIRGLQPLLVSSDGRWVGAAIVGWIPHFRKLWLSDGLVAQLSGRELDMVILHELAHVARRHFLWRTVPLLVSVALMATAWMALQHLTHGGQELAPWQFLFCGCAGIAIVATLGAAARRCELDADYWACTLALDACEWSRGAPQLPSLVLSAALEKLLSQEPDRNRATWLHPSLDRRLKGLADWRQDHRASR